MKYCYHVSAGALDHYFHMLEKIKKQIKKHCATGPTFAYFLALLKIKVMWSVLVSSIGTIIEDAHMS